MKYQRQQRMSRQRGNIRSGLLIRLLGAVFAISMGGAAMAQTGAPASGQIGTDTTTPGVRHSETITLARALEQLSSRSGVLVVADSTVAYERVPVALTAGEASTTAPTAVKSEPDVEKQIRALLKVLPAGTGWGKLYLPAQAPGRAVWKGDDIATFAFAQARLFGNVGAPTPEGEIELLGKRVGKEAAPTYVTGLDLKPVYLLTNPKRQYAVVTPWSSASQEQWANMSRDERKQYGQQQAAWIMSLPQEQRDRMLDQIRQHDKYFDTVKDPLEKLLGHDLYARIARAPAPILLG